MEKFKIVHASLVDYDLKITLYALTNIVQNAVTETLGSIQFDNINMKERYHAMWVFTKNKLTCHKRPVWNDEIKITCRVVKTTHLIAYMLVEIFNSDNELVVSSLVELCAIDVTSYRFVRLSNIDFITVDENIDNDYTLEQAEYEEFQNLKVKPMMIDFSKHLNNAQSIFIYLDSLEKEELDLIYSKPFTFTIKYANQAKLNEEIFLYKKNKEG
ncbi:MAG: hypothetical protein K2I77_06795, partial [Anaeroplasmataceae bacterium]|nr:hypothetical protein [Anaeroplasmataceae bacterium]